MSYLKNSSGKLLKLSSGKFLIKQAEEVNPYFAVNWSNYAITCGQNTNNYNAWAPNALQYDSKNDMFIFLQCHTTKHINGTLSSWTLSRIYPDEPWKVDDLGLPEVNALGALWVEDGAWYVIQRESTSMYKSSDMGATWEQLTTNISAPLWGIYKCNGVYYSGDDYTTDTYYTSTDLITWQPHNFGFSDSYSALMEASFCWYKNYVWAFLRTNDSDLGHPVILKSADGITWELASDSLLHSYRSIVGVVAYDDYIAIADIDRDNGMLYYSRFDGTTVEVLNQWKVESGGDDFHCPCLCTDNDKTVILAYMGHSWMMTGNFADTTQYYCENMMIVGSIGEGALHSVTFEDMPFTKTSESVPELFDVYPTDYVLTYPNVYRVGTTDSTSGTYEAALVAKGVNTFAKNTYNSNEYFYRGNKIVAFYNSENPSRLGTLTSMNSGESSAIVDIGGGIYSYSYNEGLTIPSLQKRTVEKELEFVPFNDSYPQVSGVLSATESLGLTKQIPVHSGTTNYTNVYPRTAINFVRAE